MTRLIGFTTRELNCWGREFKSATSGSLFRTSRIADSISGLDRVSMVCWGTYAYMHICTKSIQIYFSIFLDFILVLLSFHCLHTVPIFPNFFSKIFPIFLAILFTSKACHFDTALLILLLFKHPHSHALCGIKWYYMQCARSLRHAERSWSRGRKQGICGLRHPLAFPSSVFWQSLRRWEPIVSLPLLY